MGVEEVMMPSQQMNMQAAPLPVQQMIVQGPTEVFQAPPMQQIIAAPAEPVYVQSQQMQAPQMTYAAPQMTYAAPQMMQTFAAPTQFVETMAAPTQFVETFAAPTTMMAAPTTMMAAPTMTTMMAAPTTMMAAPTMM